MFGSNDLQSPPLPPRLFVVRFSNGKYRPRELSDTTSYTMFPKAPIFPLQLSYAQDGLQLEFLRLTITYLTLWLFHSFSVISLLLLCIHYK